MGQNFGAGLASLGQAGGQALGQWQQQQAQQQEAMRQERIMQGRLAKQQAMAELANLRQSMVNLSPEERAQAGADQATQGLYSIINSPDEQAAVLFQNFIQPKQPSLGDVNGPSRIGGMQGWRMQPGSPGAGPSPIVQVGPDGAPSQPGQGIPATSPTMVRQPVQTPGYLGVLGRVEQLNATKAKSAKDAENMGKEDAAAFDSYKKDWALAFTDIQSQLKDLRDVPAGALTDEQKGLAARLQSNLTALNQMNFATPSQWAAAGRKTINVASTAGDTTQLIQDARQKAIDAADQKARAKEESDLETKVTMADYEAYRNDLGKANDLLSGQYTRLTSEAALGMDPAERDSLIKSLDDKKKQIAELPRDYKTWIAQGAPIIDTSTVEGKVALGLIKGGKSLMEKKEGQTTLTQTVESTQKKALLTLNDVDKILSPLAGVNEEYLTDEDRATIAELQQAKTRLTNLAAITPTDYAKLDDAGKNVDVSSLLNRATQIGQKATSLADLDRKAQEADKVRLAQQNRAEDIARDGLTNAHRQFVSANQGELQILAAQRGELEKIPPDQRPANYQDVLTKIDDEIGLRTENSKLTPEQYQASGGQPGDLRGTLKSVGQILGGASDTAYKLAKSSDEYQMGVRGAASKAADLKTAIKELESIPPQQQPANWGEALAKLQSALELEEANATSTSPDKYRASGFAASGANDALRMATSVKNVALGIEQEQVETKQQATERKAAAAQSVAAAQMAVQNLMESPGAAQADPKAVQSVQAELYKLAGNPLLALEAGADGQTRGEALVAKALALGGGDPTLAAVLNAPAAQRYELLKEKGWVITDPADPNVGQLNDEGKKVFGNLAGMAAFSTGYTQSQKQQGEPIRAQLSEFINSEQADYIKRTNPELFAQIQGAANNPDTSLADLNALLPRMQNAQSAARGYANVQRATAAGVELTAQDLTDLKSSDQTVVDAVYQRIEDRILTLPKTQQTEKQAAYLVQQFDNRLTDLTNFLDSDLRNEAEMLLGDPNTSFLQKAEKLNALQAKPEWKQALDERGQLGKAQTEEFYRRVKQGQTQDAFARADIMAKAYQPGSAQLNGFADELIKQGVDPATAKLAQAFATQQAEAIKEGRELDGIKLGTQLAQVMTPQQIDALVKKSPAIAKSLGVSVQYAKEQAGTRQRLEALGIRKEVMDLYAKPTNMIGKDGRVMNEAQFNQAVDDKMLLLKKELATQLGTKDLNDPSIVAAVKALRRAEEAGYRVALAEQNQQDRGNRAQDTQLRIAQGHLEVSQGQLRLTERGLEYEAARLGISREQLRMEARRLGITEQEFIWRKETDTRDYNLRRDQWEDSVAYRNDQATKDDERWKKDYAIREGEYALRKNEAGKRGVEAQLGVIQEQSKLYAADVRAISSDIRGIDSQIRPLLAAAYRTPEQSQQLQELQATRQALVERQNEVKGDLGRINSELAEFGKANKLPFVAYTEGNIPVDAKISYTLTPEAQRVLYDRMAKDSGFATKINTLLEWAAIQQNGTADAYPEKKDKAKQALASFVAEEWNRDTINAFVSSFDPSRVPESQRTGLFGWFASSPQSAAFKAAETPSPMFTGSNPTKFNLSELPGLKQVKQPVQGVQVVATPAGQKAAALVSSPALQTKAGVFEPGYCARFVRLCLADGTNAEKQVASLFITGNNAAGEPPTALMTENKFMGLTDKQTGRIKGTDSAMGGSLSYMGGTAKLVPGDVVFASKTDPRGHVGLIVADKDGNLWVSENTTAKGGAANRLTPLNEFQARPGGITYVVRPNQKGGSR